MFSYALIFHPLQPLFFVYLCFYFLLLLLFPETIFLLLSRSPGGTPVGRRRSKGGAALLNDPAALIAEALKRKFAKHRHNNSSDKENSLDLSPFGSPEVPKVCFLQTHTTDIHTLLFILVYSLKIGFWKTKS